MSKKLFKILIRWLLLFTILLIRMHESAEAEGDLSIREDIGLEAVWNPPNIVWNRMQEECRPVRQVDDEFTECVATIMKEAGAPSQAIAFTRLIKGDGYMTSFHEEGKVDLGTVFYPFRANDNCSILLLNGVPKVIDVNDRGYGKNLDISKDELYPSLIDKYPKLQLWGHAGFKEVKPLPNGGQRFIFALVLLNGCHACEIGGYADIAYNFDSAGKFLGTKLIKLNEPKAENGIETPKEQPQDTPVQISKEARQTYMPTLPLVATVEGQLPVFSPDGRFIVMEITQGDGKYITKLWEAKKGQLFFQLERDFEAFSPDGDMMVVSYRTEDWKTIEELWDVPGKRFIRRLNLSPGESISGFSPDSTLMVTCSWNNCRLWEVMSGELLDTIEAKFPFYTSRFSSDGKLLAIRLDDFKTLLWDVKKNKALRVLEGKFLDFSHDGSLVATRVRASAKIWETASGKPISSVGCWGYGYLSKDGRFITTSVYDYKLNRNDSTPKLWEVSTGKLITPIEGNLLSPKSRVIGYRFGDVGVIATVLEDNRNNRSITKIWNADTGQLIASVEGYFTEFSPDGSLVMTGIWWEKPEHSTKVWKSDSGQLVAWLEGYPVSFSPDGKLIATGMDKGVRIWRLK